MYSPAKYFFGLSAKAKKTRKREIRRFGKKGTRDPSAYVGFKTDKGVKTKTSSYTQKFRAKFPKAKTLKQKSQATGVPLSALRKSYNRGMAAWRTGHRPGATQQQWGYARVHSLLTCGKTYRTADSDIVKNAKAKSASARRWWTRCKR
jgi:hypothetical protein